LADNKNGNGKEICIFFRAEVMTSKNKKKERSIK